MTTDQKPLLACGHRANSTITDHETGARSPGCAICVGLAPGATTPVPEPDLTGRSARCSCGATRPSDSERGLAFFEYLGPKSPAALQRCRCGYYDTAHVPGARYQVKDHPFKPHGAYEFDTYYCGHAGWD